MKDAEKIRELLEKAKDHYWDTLEPHRDLILKHLEALLKPCKSNLRGKGIIIGPSDLRHLDKKPCGTCGGTKEIPNPITGEGNKWDCSDCTDKPEASEFVKKFLEQHKFIHYDLRFREGHVEHPYYNMTDYLNKVEELCDRFEAAEAELVRWKKMREVLALLKPEPQDELKDWDIETELFECCKICPECSFKLQGFKDYACDRLAQAGADRKALQAALVDMQQLTEKLTNEHESDIKVAQEYEQLQQQLAEAKKEIERLKEKSAMFAAEIGSEIVRRIEQDLKGGE